MMVLLANTNTQEEIWAGATTGIPASTAEIITLLIQVTKMVTFNQFLVIMAMSVAVNTVIGFELATWLQERREQKRKT
jgi:hypothetical protein